MMHEEPEFLTIDYIDSAPWITLLNDRFGIPTESFESYRWYQPNRKLISLLNTSMQPPRRPEPISMGLPFIRINMKYPKLTTGGTLFVGPLATKNVVELTEEQVNSYYSRAMYIPLTEEQTTRCTTMGYIILSFQGIILGQGFYRPKSEEEDANFDSFYPKAFANHAQRSALG